MSDVCPHCAARINPGPEPDSYEAWQTRLGRTNRYLAEEAMRTFAHAYPDPWSVIVARRTALNREAAAIQAPGRRTPGRRTAA